MLGMGSPTAQPGTALQAIRKLSSSFPNPTNAQAVAALDAFSQVDAASAIDGGVPDTIAQSFLRPAGILPRMRLLAWGWTNVGDKFKLPTDAAWWGKSYGYPLWNPLTTYLTEVTKAGFEPPAVFWDSDLARGDVAELSRSMQALQQDAGDVFEAPCPRWLIGPKPGQLPVLNPECIRRDLEKQRGTLEKIVDIILSPFTSKTSDAASLILVIAVGYLLLKKGK